LDKNRIAQVALEEIENPTFELTKQYLEANILKMKGNIPHIEDVIISEDKLSAEVYFPVLDEPFYFVIYFDLEPEIEVRFMSMSAGNRVELFVCSDSVELDEFIGLLKISPKERWKKGQSKIINGLKNCPPHIDNGFIYAPIDRTVGEVECKLDYLLSELLPYKDVVRELEKVAEVEIQITYFGYKDEMWGINLKPHTIQMISEIGVSLDIDLYASGNDLYKD
jgi:hypothetical protein